MKKTVYSKLTVFSSLRFKSHLRFETPYRKFQRNIQKWTKKTYSSLSRFFARFLIWPDYEFPNYRFKPSGIYLVLTTFTLFKKPVIDEERVYSLSFWNFVITFFYLYLNECMKNGWKKSLHEKSEERIDKKLKHIKLVPPVIEVAHFVVGEVQQHQCTEGAHHGTYGLREGV